MMGRGMTHVWIADRARCAAPDKRIIPGTRTGTQTGISAGNRIGIKNEIRNKGAYQS